MGRMTMVIARYRGTDRCWPMPLGFSCSRSCFSRHRYLAWLGPLAAAAQTYRTQICQGCKGFGDPDVGPESGLFGWDSGLPSPLCRAQWNPARLRAASDHTGSLCCATGHNGTCRHPRGWGGDRPLGEDMESVGSNPPHCDRDWWPAVPRVSQLLEPARLGRLAIDRGPGALGRPWRAFNSIVDLVSAGGFPASPH